MTIKYNTPVEVTEYQYKKIMQDMAGVAAGRTEDGKFFIKLWVMSYSPIVNKIINGQD